MRKHFPSGKILVFYVKEWLKLYREIIEAGGWEVAYLSESGKQVCNSHCNLENAWPLQIERIIAKHWMCGVKFSYSQFQNYNGDSVHN